MRGNRDRPRVDRHPADRHRPLGDPQPEPRRVPRRHASERTRRGSEPELPVSLAPDRAAVGQGVLRATSALRAREPDREAPDRSRASRREHLVPPTARARGSVGGRHHDPASIRPTRRTPAGQARGTLSGQRHQLAEPLASRGGRVRRRAAERIAVVGGGRPVRARDRERDRLTALSGRAYPCRLAVDTCPRTTSGVRSSRCA